MGSLEKMTELEKQQIQKTMELAARTGGRAYLNTNDLAKAIRDAVNDSTLTYTLGFYPDDYANDGKFHKIEVKMPEHSGLNLHYRKSYVDRGEQATQEPAATSCRMQAGARSIPLALA